MQLQCTNCLLIVHVKSAKIKALGCCFCDGVQKTLKNKIANKKPIRTVNKKATFHADNTISYYAGSRRGWVRNHIHQVWLVDRQHLDFEEFETLVDQVKRLRGES